MWKVYMKKILTLLSLIFWLSFTAFSQTDFSVGGGYSYLNGVVGVEAQHKNVGIGAGYFPVKLNSGERVNSFSAAITWYGKDNEYFNKSTTHTATYYASFGFASAGYHKDATQPTFIGMVGGKTRICRFNLKAGIGYSWCKFADGLTGEVGISYTLFSSH